MMGVGGWVNIKSVSCRDGKKYEEAMSKAERWVLEKELEVGIHCLQKVSHDVRHWHDVILLHKLVRMHSNQSAPAIPSI